MMMPLYCADHQNMNTTQIAAEAKFTVEHYAIICPSGQLLQRYRTLDLAKRYCRILNDELKAAIEKATKGKDKQLQSVVAFLETCKGDDWDRRELLKVLRLTVPRAVCPDCKQTLSGDEMVDREVHGRCSSQGAAPNEIKTTTQIAAEAAEKVRGFFDDLANGLGSQTTLHDIIKSAIEKALEIYADKVSPELTAKIEQLQYHAAQGSKHQCPNCGCKFAETILSEK